MNPPFFAAASSARVAKTEVVSLAVIVSSKSRKKCQSDRSRRRSVRLGGGAGEGEEGGEEGVLQEVLEEVEEVEEVDDDEEEEGCARSRRRRGRRGGGGGLGEIWIPKDGTLRRYTASSSCIPI